MSMDDLGLGALGEGALDEAHTWTLTETSQALSRNEVLSREILEMYLTRIEVLDASLNAYITILADTAFAQAEASDERRLSGISLGPLDGIPIAIKDNIDIAGSPTTAGIPGRRNATAAADAPVIAALREAGAVLIGKTNMHEAAFGGTTDNQSFGQCQNPHRDGFTPGGSSGGSGAAVAASLACGALGTDTLGSVRIPSAYCGIAGIKPTYGLVSTRDVVPLSWTLDHVGPMARSVEDLFPLLQAMAKFDHHCPFSRVPSARMDFGAHGDSTPAGLKIGVARFSSTKIDADVETLFEKSIDQFRELGAEIIDDAVPDLDLHELMLAGILISQVEGGTALEGLVKSNDDGMSSNIRELFKIGLSRPAEDLALAFRKISEVTHAFGIAFEGVDALIMPTMPQTAFAFNTIPPSNLAHFTSVCNLARGPAVSVPMGRASNGLPAGLQIVCPEFHDAHALRLGLAYERAAAHNMSVQE